MNKSHFTPCILMILVFLSACTGLHIKPWSANTTTPTSAIKLTPCTVAFGRVRAECGTLRVPEDRTNPNGRILELGVVVARARKSDHAPDPLFYIAGGPGVAATDPNVVYSVNSILWDVNARHDIVFLDQRGTNGKHRLTCDPIPFNTLDTPQQKMDDWMKQCLSTLDGDPRFYTTVAAMRDLDDAREALGYDKIDLYGISYGVAAEQVYMRMFPEHVHAVVMDHGHPADLPYANARPDASQSALDQVFTYCEQDEKCHAAYPDIRSDWQGVIDQLAKGPVATSLIADDGTTPVQVNMEGFESAIYDLMYKSGTYAGIPLLIHSLASQVDWTPIVKNYAAQQGSSQPEPLLLMHEMITCFDPGFLFQPDHIAQLNSPSIFRDMNVITAEAEQKVCASLPKPDPSLIYSPGKPAPLSALMLNSLLDPIFPPANMGPVLKEFTKSRVIAEPTEGHDTSASKCRWSIVAQYIEQGSVDGLDISCMEKQKPSFVIGN